MELNKEKISDLSENQFKTLLNFIGINDLKKILIANALDFPKTSAYYIGPRTTGQFWSGFRKEKLPDSKVVKFYIAEVLQKKTNLNIEFFYRSIDRRIQSISDFDENFVLNQDDELREVLCILFDVKIDESTQKHINELNELKKEYEKRIIALREDHAEQIELIKNEALQQKNEYESMIKTLKKQISDIKMSDAKEKNELIIGIMEKSNYSNITADIKKLNLENYSAAKEFLLQSFNKNLGLLEDSDYVSLAKELTIQYIITKILEDK